MEYWQHHNLIDSYNIWVKEYRESGNREIATLMQHADIELQRRGL